MSAQEHVSRVKSGLYFFEKAEKNGSCGLETILKLVKS